MRLVHFRFGRHSLVDCCHRLHHRLCSGCYQFVGWHFNYFLILVIVRHYFLILVVVPITGVNDEQQQELENNDEQQQKLENNENVIQQIDNNNYISDNKGNGNN